MCYFMGRNLNWKPITYKMAGEVMEMMNECVIFYYDKNNERIPILVSSQAHGYLDLPNYAKERIIEYYPQAEGKVYALFQGKEFNLGF